MKLPLKLSKQLVRLSNGERLSFSQNNFSGRSRNIVDTLIKDGLLNEYTVNRRKREVFCNDSQALENYIHNKYEISNLKEYIEFLQKDERSRSDAIRTASDSKIANTNVWKGFMINSYATFDIELNQKRITLPPNRGSFLFISDYESFMVPTNVTIVVVENYENFRYVDRQKHLFENITPLFIWRYANSRHITNWLKQIPNDYLHFGDFDLKGIHIYITEFKKKTPNKTCSFFIPKNIINLFDNYGTRKKYSEQRQNLKNFDFSKHSEIMKLYNIITQYKRRVEQEILITIEN